MQGIDQIGSDISNTLSNAGCCVTSLAIKGNMTSTYVTTILLQIFRERVAKDKHI